MIKRLILLTMMLLVASPCYAITFDEAIAKYGVSDKSDFEKKIFKPGYDPTKPKDTQLKQARDFATDEEWTEHYAFQLTKRYLKL